MKNLLLLLILFGASVTGMGQKGVYKGKIYIFDFYEEAKVCDLNGSQTGEKVILLKGSLFTVERVLKNNDLIIKFLNWKENSKNYDKINQYNYTLEKEEKSVTNSDGTTRVQTALSKVENTEKFFLISKTTFDNYCSEYKQEPNWSLSLGSLSTPFKLRFNPFLFTTNLNLGTTLAYRYNWKNGFNVGGTLGISLSSVTLDSLSTNGKVSSITERPTFTPTLGFMVGYKNINLTVNGGVDLINRISNVEHSWIYHGKPWIGIGLGISLFKIDNTGSVPNKQP